MSESIGKVDHFAIPILAVCGWSGSGKTWLLEKLIQRFSRKGYDVGIIKHDAHHLELDHPGKNSYRLWQAGAQSLLAHDEEQWFLRGRKDGQKSFNDILLKTAHEADFVLVEGHKSTHLPKIWLDHPEKPGIPDDLEQVIARLPWGDNRLDEAELILLTKLGEQWRSRPVMAGILVGGKSRRMGFPKHTLEINGHSVLQSLLDAVKPYTQQTALIGNVLASSLPEIIHQNNIMVLPDIMDCNGPMAGMLSAFRWNPFASWLFLACDMPNVKPRTINWILNNREFGKWGVAAKDKQFVHPLLAVYEPPMAQMFEDAWFNLQYSLTKTIQHKKIKMADIPPDMLLDCANCNTPEEAQAPHNLFKSKDQTSYEN